MSAIPQMSTITCPGCGALVANADLLSIEIRGVYDGGLIWQHEGTCGHMWPRFTVEQSPRRHRAAVEWIARHGEAVS